MVEVEGDYFVIYQVLMDRDRKLKNTLYCIDTALSSELSRIEVFNSFLFIPLADYLSRQKFSFLLFLYCWNLCAYSYYHHYLDVAIIEPTL